MYWCDGEDRDKDCESELDVCNRDFDDLKEEVKFLLIKLMLWIYFDFFCSWRKESKIKEKRDIKYNWDFLIKCFFWWICFNSVIIKC